MKRPDLFIVGAPKSGTTALDAYLRAHPDIFMATKECHFFGTDLGVQRGRSLDDYLLNFRDAANERRVGEASVMYLSSHNAAREISEFAPDALIIIMLRNPIDMIYARHSQLVRDGQEDLLDFGAALEAEKDRRHGKRIPKIDRRGYSPPTNTYAYREIGVYSSQIQRFWDHFPRENVHIIIFDDFVKDVEKSYRQTLHFLEVDDRHTPDFKVVNANAVTRSQTIQDLIHNSPAFVWRTLDRVMSPERKQRLYRRLNRWNTKEVRRKPMDPAIRQRLQDEFRPEVERLSELLGRDLSHWCASPLQESAVRT